MADANGNGNGVRMEAIARNVVLAAVSRVMMTVGTTALLGISAWGANALWNLYGALQVQTANIAAIERRLDRIDTNADAAAGVVAGLQKQIDDNHTEARTAAADLQAKLDVVNGRLAPMWDAVARIQAAILQPRSGKP